MRMCLLLEERHCTLQSPGSSDGVMGGWCPNLKSTGHFYYRGMWLVLLGISVILPKIVLPRYPLKVGFRGDHVAESCFPIRAEYVSVLDEPIYNESLSQFSVSLARQDRAIFSGPLYGQWFRNQGKSISRSVRGVIRGILERTNFSEDNSLLRNPRWRFAIILINQANIRGYLARSVNDSELSRPGKPSNVGTPFNVSHYPCAFAVNEGIGAGLGCGGVVLRGFNRLLQNVRLFFHLSRLPSYLAYLFPHCSPLANHDKPLLTHGNSLSADCLQSPTQQNDLQSTNYYQAQVEGPVPPVRPVSFVFFYRHGGKFGDTYGMLCIVSSLSISGSIIVWGLFRIGRRRRLSGWFLFGLGLALDCAACASGFIGCLPWDWWRCLHDGQEHSQRERFHSKESVTHKYWTSLYLCNTVIDMANVLTTDKQIAIISALAEGSSIRSIERITGVHRDTIMRLGVRVGNECQMLLSAIR
jgi:hypothetical protein